MTHRRRGFTLNELATVLVLALVVAVLLALMLPLFAHGHKGSVKPLKDAQQLRDIHRAMIVWTQQNGDRYPLPSALDRDDATVRVDGDATLKDSTGAVYSILIFNQLVEAEKFFSPAEPNGQLDVHYSYQRDDPESAVMPSEARWDPSFRGTPLDPAPGGGEADQPIGHTSYAHLALAGDGRMKHWTFTAGSATPILGTRGPQQTGGTWLPAREAGSWDRSLNLLASTQLAEGPTGTESLCLLMFSEKTAWSGNIVYNDNHVVQEKSTHPDAVRYVAIHPGGYSKSGITVSRFGDGLFLDEGDPGVLDGVAAEDVRDANCYLGLFRRGPSEPERTQHGEASAYIRDARWYDGMGK
jgi:hypothetical protein